VPDVPLPSSLPAPTTLPLESRSDAVLATAARTTTTGAPSAMPSPREVLSALPPAAATAAGAPSSAAVTDDPLVRIGWTGTARTVVRRVNPRFPTILSATGQEGEIEARITVSPLGAVVDVEITRSSGYIEIDAEFETVLRQWLFSRVEGKQNAVGTVSGRYRLGKRD
jgi:TonB family protein